MSEGKEKRKDTRVRDRREYNKAHHGENQELHNLRRARAYYLKTGTTPGERSTLAWWCREHGIDLETVMRQGIPKLGENEELSG
jgi:hypothetical protein